MLESISKVPVLGSNVIPPLLLFTTLVTFIEGAWAPSETITVTSSPIKLAAIFIVPVLALALVTVKAVVPLVEFTTPLTVIVSVASTAILPTASSPPPSIVTVAGSMSIPPLPACILLPASLPIVKAVVALRSINPLPVVVICPAKPAVPTNIEVPANKSISPFTAVIFEATA